MKALKAIFSGETVDLSYGIVYSIDADNGGKVAWINTPEGERTFRFWMERRDNLFGSRFGVKPQRGKSYPTISKRTRFDVAVGDVVLFLPPDNQSTAVFPVISHKSYQAAERKLERMGLHVKTGEAPTRKKDHRWVD